MIFETFLEEIFLGLSAVSFLMTFFLLPKSKNTNIAIEKGEIQNTSHEEVGINVDTDSKKYFDQNISIDGDIFNNDSKNLTTQERLSAGLEKSKKGFFEKFSTFFSFNSGITETSITEVESLLLSSDLGPKTSFEIIRKAKIAFKEQKLNSTEDFIALIKSELINILELPTGKPSIEDSLEKKSDLPNVFLIVGVNGVGKTTSIAKLAYKWKSEGKKILLIAADTFRAAAVEQLKHWGQKINVEVFSGAENSKPASVIFDGLTYAKSFAEKPSEKFDLVIIDTAGRLHNRANLMQELDGIKNIIKRFDVAAPSQTLLVLDACTGQNALSQAKEFNDITELTGIIITKLDGTPKGGIVVAIKQELGIPVRFIGVGEKYSDLQTFEATNFVEALLDIDLSGIKDYSAENNSVLKLNSSDMEQQTAINQNNAVNIQTNIANKEIISTDIMQPMPKRMRRS